MARNERGNRMSAILPLDESPQRHVVEVILRPGWASLWLTRPLTKRGSHSNCTSGRDAFVITTDHPIVFVEVYREHIIHTEVGTPCTTRTHPPIQTPGHTHPHPDHVLCLSSQPQLLWNGYITVSMVMHPHRQKHILFWQHAEMCRRDLPRVCLQVS